MFIVMFASEEPLEKRNKGTILRQQAERRFEKQIQEAYKGPFEDGKDLLFVPNDALRQAVFSIMQDTTSVVAPQVNETYSLLGWTLWHAYRSGTGFKACSQNPLRNFLSMLCMIAGQLGDLQNSSTIVDAVKPLAGEDELQLMLDLVKDHSHFETLFHLGEDHKS